MIATWASPWQRHFDVFGATFYPYYRFRGDLETAGVKGPFFLGCEGPGRAEVALDGRPVCPRPPWVGFVAMLASL